jgi:TRAP-type uncharacterized transport system substrate-binding protein
MSTGPAHALLARVLTFLQSNRRVRIALGALIVGALLFVAVRSLYGLIPRHFTLSITGGDIVGNRHYLARILQAEAHKKDLTLIVRPEEGSLAALEEVSEGRIDLAFVQGGGSADFPNVEHVASVAPELLHLLVKPGVKGMSDLRGHSVNLGVRDGTEHEVALTIMQFARYVENVDYVETSYDAEQLLSLPDRAMPDAIFIISSVPSYLVELLVRERQYDVVEIPFPEALAMRYGWAADARILSYAYNTNPPVPAKNIQTVAVNVHLVANARTDPAAISKLLEVLYSPSVANQLRQPIDPSRIAVSSGYPISRGMTAYLTRNDAIITLQTWQKLTSLFGLFMSFSGVALVVLRWLRGAKSWHDEEFHQYLAEVATIARTIFTMEAQGKLDVAELKRLRDRLAGLRTLLIERYPKVSFKDPLLFDRCIASVRATHDHAGRLLAAAEAIAQP